MKMRSHTVILIFCKLTYLSFYNQHKYCPVVNSTTVDYSAFLHNCICGGQSLHAYILLRLTLLIPRIVGLCLAYWSIVAPKGSDSNWEGYPESHFHWLFSGKNQSLQNQNMYLHFYLIHNLKKFLITKFNYSPNQ